MSLTSYRLILIACLSPFVAHAAVTVDAIILPYKEVSLSVQAKGALHEFVVKEGATVKAGDLLARLQSATETLEVDRTQRIFERKQFDDAGTAKLFADNMTSAEDALEKKIEAQIAEIDLNKAKAELEKMSVRAPISGIIVRQYKEVGEWVEPGMQVFDIVDIEQVYAQLLLSPAEAFALKHGQTITVSLPELDGNPSFTGPIEFIAPVVDASSNLVRVKVLLHNTDGRIKSGLRGMVTLP